jgi:hypothetical protein
MFSKMKKVLKIGALLGFILFISLQVLNVRSPITIGVAQADSGARVKGYTYTYDLLGHKKALGGARVTLCNPNGTPYTVSSSNNSYNKGYFEFPRSHTAANGSYQIIFEKLCYNTVSTNFSMDQYKGANVTVTMLSIGNSSIGVVPFFPWY